MVHNFISDSESEDLIKKAGAKLKRSSVASEKQDQTYEYDEKRLSEQAWVDEKMSLSAKHITARLDEFLDVEATSKIHSESYQG